MKTTTSGLKVMILGASRVGKSAVAVRFLTKRFIGEYSSGSDCTYQTMFRYEDAALKVEIVDCSPGSDPSSCRDLELADALVVVYSIVDRDSLKAARAIMQDLNRRIHGAIPVLLLGNKTDLEHARQVARDDVSVLTQQYKCSHCEVSAAESFSPVNVVMQQLLEDGIHFRRTRVGQVKRRRSLFENVSRRLGSVFRRKSLDGSPPKRKVPHVSSNINRRSIPPRVVRNFRRSTSCCMGGTEVTLRVVWVCAHFAVLQEPSGQLCGAPGTSGLPACAFLRLLQQQKH